MGKFKFSYKRFAVTVMVGAILAATTATAAFSYAWFTNHNNVTNNDLHGSTAGAYFARGDGTQDNPYVINQPIHLYNLAWLQYIGAFDGEEPYFIIETNLDMNNEWTLPPIGTTDHPFTGHLDGYDKTHSQNQTSTAKISNLTISNDFAAYNGKHPAAVTKDNFQTLNITGLFGVIEQPTKDTTTPSLKNLYVDNLTVSSTTGEALTGLVAGYVNGKIDGVGISDSKLDLASGTKTTSYNGTTFQNISKYTSVGYCTENYETSYAKTNTTMYKPEQVGTASFNPTGGGGGQENDWGGSIDMRAINRRINYIGAVSTLTMSGNYPSVASDDYHFYSTINFGREFKWNGDADWKKQSNICYINSGTIMPLNIDEEKAFAGDELTYGSEKWHTTKWYSSKKKEEVLPSNTGYLVSGNTSSQKQGDIRSKIAPIGTAFTNYSNNGIENLSVYSLDTTASNGTIQAIGDNPEQQFGYKKYESVHHNFVNAMQGSETVHGFHFMQGVADDIGQLKTVKASNVTIAKTPFPTYEFVTSGLNFSVANTGRITSLLGTHYQDRQNQSLFDLFHVEREKGIIKTLKRIKGVYESNDGTVNYSYYNDNTTPSGKLVFDFSKVTGGNDILTSNRAYYFEFPVAKGDYVIGKSLNSDKTNAYLMYLDIGANAGGTSGNKVDRTKIYEVFEQVNEEFKYPNGVGIVNFADAGVDSKKFAVAVGASYTGEVKLNYAGDNNASITVTESSDTGLGYYDAGLSFTSGQTKQVGAITTHTRTQRLTYFDHYREDESNTATPYTNVLQFSQTQTMKSGAWSAWSDTARSDYRSGKGNADDFSELSETETLTIYDDEGKTATIPTIATPSSEEVFWESKVFTLQTTDPAVKFIDADWIQTGSYPTESETTPYVFKVSGYKFTMKDSTGTDLNSDQYSISIKNADYAVSINPKP